VDDFKREPIVPRDDPPSGEPAADEPSAVAVSVGDTAELTALDPHGDHLPEVAGPEFAVVLRGYDRASVDAYVMHVTELVAELQSVRSPKAAVRKALDRVGKDTAAVLQRAQDAADELTAESRSKSGERVQEAEREAAKIVEDAHERVKQLDADTEALWAERRRLIEDVKRIADALRDSADEAIERFPAEEEPAAEAEAVADAEPAVDPAPTEPLTPQPPGPQPD
jgi:cell division septum initiation protein DivIVA